MAAGQALDHEPRPRVPAKKGARDRLIRLAARHPEWALGFEDETGGSRVAQPTLASWSAAAQPMRLVEPTPGTAEPKALAGYGLLVRAAGAPEAIWLRFVDGQPVSAVTIEFLRWGGRRLAAQGTRVLLLIWDQASWHGSRAVRRWLRAHNRWGKQTGRGVRLALCPLPRKSPWLTPIEPKWVHGKRRVVDPAGRLTADVLAARVCAAFGCAHEPHLAIPDKVA